MYFNPLYRNIGRSSLPANHVIGKRFFFRVLTLSMLCLQANAYASQPSETEIKLVYLYNFTKFVSWPENAFPAKDSPFKLCIFGDAPAQELVASLRKKTTAGRRFDILFPKDLSDIPDCHITFFHQLSATLTKRILRATLASPTLTVSDLSGFANDGGIIEFVRDEQQRIRIRVNISNASKCKLNISATLLEIAINTYQ